MGQITTFKFVGQTFHIPNSYLGGGLPRPEFGPQDAVRLQAWAPNLAPLTAEQARTFQIPLSAGVRITVFGHPQFLHGQALLDEFIKAYGHENRNGERNAFGFTILRARAAGIALGEIHVSPEGPENLFHCSIDGSVRYPGCTAQRWIGGPLRVEMDFDKPIIADYPALDAGLAGFMRCALGPSGTPGQVWPLPGRHQLEKIWSPLQ
ncbi:hypothetical protein ACFQU2_14160 [Siccirubricoccus deserti]